MIQWNSEYEQTTGYSAGELSTMTQFDLVQPQEHARFREVIDTVIATGSAKGEFTKVKKRRYRVVSLWCRYPYSS